MKKLYPLLFLFLLCGNIQAQTIDLPSDGDLAATIAGLTAGTAVINLPAGSTYAGLNVDLTGITITIPLNVNLTISGPAVGLKPVIRYKNFEFTTATTTSVTFVNVELVNGQGSADQYLFNVGTAVICTVPKIEFNNCIIRDYKRSVVRTQNTGTVINEIIFDNCIIKNIGIESGQNYVLVNGAGEIKKITVKNSTLTNLVKGFIDLKTVTVAGGGTVGGADEINILDCTFNNNIVDTRSFFNLQANITKTALALNVTNSIFGSTQQTANNVKGINNATAGLVITQTVTNSFKTSDWILVSGDFNNLTAYTGASTALFTDPLVTGDFTFKDAGFTGKATAGDPRWRSLPTVINDIEGNKAIRIMRYGIEVNSGLAEISVYNLQGKLMKRATGRQLSTEELQSGVYLVSVLSEGKRYTTKFIKQ
jgi:hypothetical protein